MRMGGTADTGGAGAAVGFSREWPIAWPAPSYPPGAGGIGAVGLLPGTTGRDQVK